MARFLYPSQSGGTLAPPPVVALARQELLRPSYLVARPAPLRPDVAVLLPGALRRLMPPGKGPPLGSPYYLGLSDPAAKSPYVRPGGVSKRILGLTQGQKNKLPVPDLGDVPPAFKAAFARTAKLIDQVLSGNYDPAMAQELLGSGAKLMNNYRQRAARLYQQANAIAKENKSLAATLRKQAAEILKTKGGSIWSAFQRMAYIYMAGKSRLLGGLIKNNPWMGQMIAGIQGGSIASAAGIKLIKKLSAGGNLDASSIVDTASLAFNAVKAIVSVAAALDLMAKGTAADIVGWGGVISGCVSGILTGASAAKKKLPGAAFGGLLGTVGCGMSIMTRVLSAEHKTPAAPPLNVPRAIYTPNLDQQPFVAADAARLASTLRYWYGMRSVGDVLLRAGWNRHLQYLQRGQRPARWAGDTDRPLGSYPGKPQFDKATGTFSSSSVPIPAPTLVDMLVLLEAVDLPPFRRRKFPDRHEWASSVWSNLGANYQRTIQPLMKAQEVLRCSQASLDPSDERCEAKWSMSRAERTHDLSVSALYAEVAYWRKELRAGRPTFGYGSYRKRLVPWGGTGLVYNPYYQYDLMDGRPFLRLSELVDYFAAITVEETRLRLNPIDAFFNTHGLPVRQLALGPKGKVAYLQTKWTDFHETAYWLYGGTSAGDHDFPRDQGSILDRIKKGGRWSWAALRILGALRVRAAMAYMINAYHWYIWKEKTKRLDMIADLPSLSAGGSTMGGFTSLFLRGPDIRQYAPVSTTFRVRAKTDPASHRDKRIYSLKARPVARLTSGDPAAALAAILRGHNELLRPVVSRALSDASYDVQYPPLFIAAKTVVIDPRALPPAAAAVPALEGSGGYDA